MPAIWTMLFHCRRMTPNTALQVRTKRIGPVPWMMPPTKLKLVGVGDHDVVMEGETEEEIEMVYNSANDPMAACNQPELSAAESLADILKSSVTDLENPKEPPSHHSA